MNIFCVSKNPKTSAIMLCDQHVVKMALESAQMLCSAFPSGKAPYKRTHFNHPCTIWVRASRQNYFWLIEHSLALCEEFEFRFGKIHKSKKVILWCRKNCSKIKFPEKGLTAFVLAMPEKFKTKSAIKSYRNFYTKDKSRFASWKHGRRPPEWYLSAVSV